MFICQVLASRGNGGLEKHVRDLSAGLVAEGHRVLIIGDPVFLETLPSNVEKKALNMRHGRFHPWLLYQLWKTLKSFPIDIIHAQANKAAYMVSLLSRFLKTPSLATLHNIKKDVSVFSRFKYVICVSNDLARLVSAENIEVIYNGIPATSESLNSSKTLPMEKRRPVICAIGRLVSAKGYDILLDAIDGLDIKLIIAGEGKLRKSLERRALHLHALTEVNLIGHSDDVIGLMKSCDGLIISSSREGFSYVFIEALMNRCNIISTDVPGASDFLAPTLIVPINDTSALRNKIATYAFNPSAWRAEMSEAHTKAKNHLTLSQMVAKTLDIYKKVIQNVS